MVFSSRSSSIKKLEKRLDELEKTINKKFDQIDDSFETFKEIITKMQSEKDEMEKKSKELEEEKEELIERHKELISKIPVPHLHQEVREKFVEPAKNKLKEDIELVKKLAKEDIENFKEGQRKEGGTTKREVATPIDELFAVVVENNKIKMGEAAKKFGVHKAQIEEWAKILEEHGLIKIHYPPIGEPELRKKK